MMEYRPLKANRTAEYQKAKREEAAKAVALYGDGTTYTYREIAAILGYNHPQSVVELIKNYGSKK